MNKVSIQTRTQVSKEILVIGFKQSFFNIITPPNGADADVYSFRESNNSFKTFTWLNKVSKDIDGVAMPYALICDYDFLKETDFFLLENTKNHSVLKNIPFIAICNRSISEEERKAALAMGLDDCYQNFVSVRDLCRRVEFLKRYKPELIRNTITNNQEQFEFKLPLGKRIFDITFASLLLLAISPILILISLLIKIESGGPIFYSSKRVGTGYNVFNFLKFRSMVVDADAQLKNLSHLNHYNGASENKDNTFMKLTNDPRVTRIGKFIRKTSLDELPQLINVLRGEMSIVGNRPLPLYEAEKMTKDEWAKRFWAPAGLTGLWQTSGKGKDNMSAEERVDLDIEYAEGFSLFMDMRIISRTLPAMIQKEA